MHALFRWSTLVSLVLLVGCGSSSAPAVSAPLPPALGSTLAGNWLLVGPMPTEGINPSSGFRLAMTFDVSGDSVVAGGFADDACSSSAQASFSFGSLTASAGPIATDGSFTMQTPPLGPPITEVQIKGTAPAVNGGPWSGSYAVSLNTTVPQSCDTNPSGTFTATSFPLVNGVYAGTATSAAAIGSTCTFTGTGTTCTPTTTGGTSTTTMAVQVTLKQGGTATDIRGNTINSNTALTGSIKVQGSPCFTSGTVNTAVGGMLGNRITATFTMDDGSTMTMIGTLTDTSEAKIATSVVTIRGGQCGGSAVPVFYTMPELNRM